MNKLICNILLWHYLLWSYPCGLKSSPIYIFDQSNFQKNLSIIKGYFSNKKNPYLVPFNQFMSLDSPMNTYSCKRLPIYIFQKSLNNNFFLNIIRRIKNK